MTDPLTIIAFLDGRPGHEKQTRGVLQALRGLTPVVVQYREIPSLSLAVALKNWLLYIGASLSPRRSRQEGAIRTDLIIGTGSYSHIPMLLLRRQRGGRAVTCMSPDRLLMGKMDLCFVPGHDGIGPSENVMLTAGPPNLTADIGRHDPGKGLILIGGIDRRSHYWDTDGIASRAKVLTQTAPRLEWTISSSPRTPEDTCRRLEALSGDAPNIDFVRSEETSAGWVEAAYAQNETVWVTADSVSMIYEALSAGCRVGILPVEWKKKRSKFRTAERELIENGWVRSYDTVLSGRDPEIKAVHLNEAARCAGEILRRWWPDRLP